MADRFANGDPSNDRAASPATGSRTGYDPTAHRLLPRRRPRRAARPARLHRGPRDDRDLADAVVQEQARAGRLARTYSAGYHGYWITDFTQIDPHLGTNAELQNWSTQAHARGIKVFFDIITNHTADVIAYDERRAEGTLHRQGRPAVRHAQRECRSTTATTPTATQHSPPSNLDSFPYTPHPRGRRDGQGPRLAQRPDDVPQPRHQRVRR